MTRKTSDSEKVKTLRCVNMTQDENKTGQSTGNVSENEMSSGATH